MDWKTKPEPGPFAARIRRRKRTWWGEEQDPEHGVSECHTRLRADAPESAWRCCPFWPRKLSNKWNGREFARRHGVAVPELYWFGADPEAVPFGDLPDRFVLRATSGHSSKNVLVIDRGRNVFDGAETGPAEIVARLEEMRRRGPSTLCFLVEEKLRPEEGERDLLIDYKCHVVKEHVVAVQVTTRESYDIGANQLAFYTPAWERMEEPLQVGAKPGPDADAPRCLDRLLRAASTLGRAYGTYVRVDLYATPRGPVFGEFTPAPTAGDWFTPSGDALLEGLWVEHCPEHT